MSCGTRRERGFALLLAALILFASALAWLALRASAFDASARRDAASDRALAQAREALIAYAAERPITAWVGPGYLPCPDLDDDGWAESTCGSQSGDLGQEERIGRLPWKTLGLPDVRDGYGERLWYAVSSKHKGLLNCAANRACVDMSPDAAIGTISVRDPSGTLVHDGTSTDLYAVERGGATAVVIAPGPPIARLDPDGMSTIGQARDCAPGQCDANNVCLTDPARLTAKCHPMNYLDKAPAGRHAGEDNADFIDRNDAAGRARNTNGFIQGPVSAHGAVVVNDRVSAIGYREVMTRVTKRVAREVAHCLVFYAARPENAGRYPAPAPACRQELADPALAWADAEGVLFGRVPDTPFARTRSASGGTMLERWWRHEARSPERLDELPTRDSACRIAFEPADDAPARRLAPGTPSDEARTAGLAENSWWNSWKPFVFYALAPGFQPQPQAPGCSEMRPCIEVVDTDSGALASAKHFAVIVAGPPIDLPGFRQRHGSALGDARNWLELANAELERVNPNPAAPQCPLDAFRPACASGPCMVVTGGPRAAHFNDALAVHPQ